MVAPKVVLDAPTFVRRMLLAGTAPYGGGGKPGVSRGGMDALSLVRRILRAGTGRAGGEGMQEFSREVMDIVSRPNSTEQERTLDLFFSKSPTSYAAGEACLQR